MNMKLNTDKISVEVYLASTKGKYPFVKNLCNDWLTMHAELEVRAELIEKLYTLLIFYGYIHLDYKEGLRCANCGNPIMSEHGDDCEIGLVLSAVEEWRKK